MKSKILSICIVGTLLGSFISCSTEEAVRQEEEVIPEQSFLVEEGSENSITSNGVTLALSSGYLEDWGVEYEGIRTYAIDLFSEDYDELDEMKGVKVGLYFNSPSPDSFVLGTYTFQEYTTPGGLMAGGIQMAGEGASLDSGTIKVERDGEIYTLTWDFSGISTTTNQRRTFTGNFKGPLPQWSIDD